METKDLLSTDLDVTPSPAETTEDTRPSLSNEDYMDLARLRSRQNEVKAEAFDLKQFIENGKSQLAQAETLLEERITTLQQVNEELTAKYNAVVVEPYDIKGNVRIEDSEPHYINIVE